MLTTGQALKHLASTITQVIVIGGALIGVIGWTGGYVNGWIEGNITARVMSKTAIGSLVKEQLKTPSARLEVLEAHAMHEIHHVPAFGKWESRSSGPVHQAMTDGFLVVQSGGRGNVPRFNLWSGSTKENLLLITRGVKYGGAALPVMKRGFYRVEIIEEQDLAKKSITAYWLPLQ